MTQTPFGPEDMARRKRRAIAMAVILLGLVALFFITTMVRLGGSIAERSL
ncbi:MAG: hypothetical protein KDK89_08955 [Alphaproteobacteria bacterium]|nr:hypothetical protein [Alphaproteobacteria bacterium]